MVSKGVWDKYITTLRRLNETAAKKVLAKSSDLGGLDDPKAVQELIDYAYLVTTTYSEASTAAACEMYDALAAVQRANVPPAVPADVPSYSDVAKTINGTRKFSADPTVTADAVSRLVKRTAADTTLQNAVRDEAYFAWVPSGDTCAFCLMLASNGWRKAGKKTLKGGHAEHIHANCDCQYAVTFDPLSGVEGYDPAEYEAMFDGIDGDWNKKVNAVRRQQYAKNKNRINVQKRAAYAKRQLVVGEQERLLTKYPNSVQLNALDAPGYAEKFQGITGKKDVDDAIYESTKEILKHRNGTNFEDLYLIDANSGEIIHKLTTCDLDNKVKYDAETVDAIKKAQKEQRELIAVHNHPGGLPPSLDDGASAYANGYVKGVAVGHNLEVYSYTPTDTFYTSSECREIHNAINKKIQFSIEFDDELWYKTLREFGEDIKRL